MRIIDKPAIEDLRPLIAEVTKNGTVPVAEWHKKFFDTAASVLADNPRLYHAYGIWWWLFKKELVDHGHIEFGEYDADWAAALDYGDTSLNIAAAWSYFNYVSEACFLYSQMHSYNYHDTEQDEEAGEIVWESGVFFVSDPEMDTYGPI